MYLLMTFMKPVWSGNIMREVFFSNFFERALQIIFMLFHFQRGLCLGFSRRRWQNSYLLVVCHFLIFPVTLCGTLLPEFFAGNPSGPAALLSILSRAYWSSPDVRGESSAVAWLKNNIYIWFSFFHPVVCKQLKSSYSHNCNCNVITKFNT